jgi:hypothetical protein
MSGSIRGAYRPYTRAYRFAYRINRTQVRLTSGNRKLTNLGSDISTRDDLRSAPPSIGYLFASMDLVPT